MFNSSCLYVEIFNGFVLKILSLYTYKNFKFNINLTYLLKSLIQLLINLINIIIKAGSLSGSKSFGLSKTQE